MKTLYILLLTSFCAFGQNVAVLTHEAANSEKFQAGFPGGWPYARPVDIGARTNLPTELAAPWVVMTAAALKTQMEALQPAVDAWAPTESDEIRNRRQTLDRIISDFKAVRDAQSNLAAAQVTAVLKEIVTVLLKMIEEERNGLK